MPLLTGRAFLHGDYCLKMKIRDSSIINTSINMSGMQIDDVGEPVVPDNVATKAYVDRMLPIPYPIVLEGETWVPIPDKLKLGTYFVKIRFSGEGKGPTACFVISKNDVLGDIQAVRQTALPGEEINEQLRVRWGPLDETLHISKSGTRADGKYIVSVM